MSVIIKGMNMPKKCVMCWLAPICPEWIDERVRSKGYEGRMKKCPLVEVADPTITEAEGEKE